MNNIIQNSSFYLLVKNCCLIFRIMYTFYSVGNWFLVLRKVLLVYTLFTYVMHLEWQHDYWCFFYNEKEFCLSRDAFCFIYSLSKDCFFGCIIFCIECYRLLKLIYGSLFAWTLLLYIFIIVWFLLHSVCYLPIVITSVQCVYWLAETNK